MVGFLHHNKKTKDDQSAKELQPFLRLPGSDVLPGRIEKDLSRVIERDMVEKKEVRKLRGVNATSWEYVIMGVNCRSAVALV